jgi:hypothetical protein
VLAHASKRKGCTAQPALLLALRHAPVGVVLPRSGAPPTRSGHRVHSKPTCPYQRAWENAALHILSFLFRATCMCDAAGPSVGERRAQQPGPACHQPCSKTGRAENTCGGHHRKTAPCAVPRRPAPACRPPGCLARAQSARLLTRPLGGGRSQGLLPRAHATMSSTLPFCAAAKFALTWGLHARWTGRKSGGRREGAHAGPTACATLAHSSRSRADGRRLMRRQAQGVLAPRSPCQPLPRPTHQLTTSQKLST